VIALGESTFRPSLYNKRKHNSVHFCREVTAFLCGRQLPEELEEAAVPPEDQIDTEVSKILDSETFAGAESSGIAFGDRKLRSRQFLQDSVIAETKNRAREASPDFIELQRQIEALR
jgi:hypothetical protein